MRTSARRRWLRAGLLAGLGWASSLGCSREAPTPTGDAGSSVPSAHGSIAAESTQRAPAPCTRALPACRGTIAVGANGKRLPYFASVPLDRPATAITRLVIALHGARHTPTGTFETVTRLAGEAAHPEAIAVIAPHFQTRADEECFGVTDTPGADELSWSCAGWKAGRASEVDPQVTAFDALDALVAQAKQSFPALQRIVVVGHSAGAQLTQRYAAVSDAERRAPTVRMRYVVGSPSSYLYLDDRRLKKDVRCTGPGDCALGASAFEAPYWDVKACPTYDDFKYGLAHREGFAIGQPDNAIRSRYASRDVVLLVGDRDTGTTDEAAHGELDKSCAAMAQGPKGRSFRMERALAFYHHARALFGARHRLSVVPGCGHDEVCVASSRWGREALFGE